MFQHLRTKLTILYAGLFGVALLLVSIAVYVAIYTNAARVVRGELVAGAAVFDRVRTLRSDQLEDGAALLSRDFGFREAVASNDEATIRSALSNLRARLGPDIALITDLNGSVRVSDGDALSGGAAQIKTALDNEEGAKGVFMIGATPYEAISAPILSPTLVGWVVFASRLDNQEMSSLEKLSAIPLDASVYSRAADGRWLSQGAPADPAIGRFLERSLKPAGDAARSLSTRDGPAIALVKTLHSMSPAEPVVLLLRYPLARALAPYQGLLDIIVAVALMGGVMLVIGSWALARNLTHPISVLDDAVHRLQRGERVEVAVETKDEIARLARSFNSMSAEIGERERRITHLAMHDPDTDLPNRLALERQLQGAKTRSGRLTVVAALGVDRFTHMRGAIGYGLSSTLIGKIAARLAEMKPGHSVARLSTDVLGLAFEATDLEDARRIAGEMQIALETPLTLDGNAIDVSLTLGLAALGVHTDDPAGLIERANIGLDQARGVHQKIAFFNPASYGDPSGNLSLMSEMRRGVAGGELVLHYQPKYALRSATISGVEALSRWQHPTRGMIPPDSFIPMAEETGHVGFLTDWVISQAIEDQKVLLAAGYDLPVSINISGRLLGELEFADRALALMAETAGRFCLEITETAVIERPDVAFQVIDKFVAAGVGISIDDYGTGFSSLSYLRQIRADELKIDKSFILRMEEGQKEALLVRSTVDLAHSLGLKVTAEGVETVVALKLLTTMGCDTAQGYLIARPMPLSKLLGYMARQADAGARPALRAVKDKP